MILATPTQMHAQQSIQCLKAGKHVQVEIPLADSLADAEAVVKAQQETGLIAMCGHTRRFNPSHQWVRKKIVAGELKVLQMDVQTYFFRRTNMNALGKPRSWTDHLLWHHAAHTVDLFQYQTGEEASVARGVQGPFHPDLGIAMDMSIQMTHAQGRGAARCRCRSTTRGRWAPSSAISATTAPTFCRYDDLFNGKNEQIDVSKVMSSMNGIELQDREFFAAIQEGREPNSSVAQVLPAYRTLDRIEKSF